MGLPPNNKMWLQGGYKQTSVQMQLNMLQSDLITPLLATDRRLHIFVDQASGPQRQHCHSELRTTRPSQLRGLRWR